MLRNSFKLNKISLFQQLTEVKKQTVFFLQTAEIWFTSSAADVCRCGPQTADVLPMKKQKAPKQRMYTHKTTASRHLQQTHTFKLTKFTTEA
ncbi:hypothetical protein Hanom_Chr02g00142341 [Helianthus anomalus]